MYVSVETIAIVISAAALLLSSFGMFIGGAAWLIRRMDAQFARVDARIDALTTEVVEVKIGLARLEGPPRHLQPIR